MVKTKKKNYKFWFMLGLLGVIIEAPNATALRQLTFDLDPFSLNIARFVIVGLVTLPFVLFALHKFNKRNSKYALLAGIYMTIAIIAFTWALKTGPASYVSIIALLTPIMLILFSVKLVHERINRRSIAGITLSAIGAMVIVILPLAVQTSGNFVFYPESTIFTLINCAAFVLSIIYSKKANEAGLPMAALIGSYSWLVVAVCALGMTATSTSFVMPSGDNLFLIAYSSLGVALLVRAISVFSYEHIGSAATGALAYLGSLLSIIVPLFVLGETLSVEMVAGGILILLGIYVIEHHKSPHHKHHHVLKGH